MIAETIGLDPALKVEFDRDGFVVARGFFSRDEVARLRGDVERYVRDAGPTLPPGDIMYEDKNRTETLKQLSHMAQNDEGFREMLLNGKTVPLAELLLGGPVVGKELEWFNKVPVYSRETPPHQDSYYFMIEPQEALTMWIALDEVDEENDCLQYVRGSHLRGLRPHVKSEILGFSERIPNYGGDAVRDEEAVPAKPGDVLIHHSMTIHLASSNSTQLAIGGHWA
jgi:phytanoyl-CoA hydroxylase